MNLFRVLSTGLILICSVLSGAFVGITNVTLSQDSGLSWIPLNSFPDKELHERKKKQIKQSLSKSTNEWDGEYSDLSSVYLIFDSKVGYFIQYPSGNSGWCKPSFNSVSVGSVVWKNEVVTLEKSPTLKIYPVREPFDLLKPIKINQKHYLIPTAVLGPDTQNLKCLDTLSCGFNFLYRKDEALDTQTLIRSENTKFAPKRQF